MDLQSRSDPLRRIIDVNAGERFSGLTSNVFLRDEDFHLKASLKCLRVYNELFLLQQYAVARDDIERLC